MPGAVVGVWHDGEIELAATGVCSTATGIDVTTDTLFQIGSITKVWTATLVMQLVDEGLVDLDAPVRTYLPDLSLADEATTAAVTVRQLLTHTSGIGDLDFGLFGRGDDCVRRFVAGLAGRPMLHEPGRFMSYCNSGFPVLGSLIETFARNDLGRGDPRTHLATARPDAHLHAPGRGVAAPRGGRTRRRTSTARSSPRGCGASRARRDRPG